MFYKKRDKNKNLKYALGDPKHYCLIQGYVYTYT